VIGSAICWKKNPAFARVLGALAVTGFARFALLPAGIGRFYVHFGAIIFVLVMLELVVGSGGIEEIEPDTVYS
jgi:hypothetical protein